MAQINTRCDNVSKSVAICQNFNIFSAKEGADVAKLFGVATAIRAFYTVFCLHLRHISAAKIVLSFIQNTDIQIYE
jgi:hypothetical protein